MNSAVWISKDIPKLQTLARILVIPWLLLVFVVSAMGQEEKFDDPTWLGWFQEPDEYKDTLKLHEGANYRFAIFVHTKDLLDHTVIFSEGWLVSEAGEVVVREKFSGLGKALTGTLAERVLNERIHKLVDNSDVDPFGKTRRLVSSSLFSVGSTGEYGLRLKVMQAPEAWSMGAMLNRDASMWPTILVGIVWLYLPIFVLNELFFLLKRLRKLPLTGVR